jgi:hypothetical protein
MVVLDKLLAFVQHPRDREWIIMSNPYLAPRTYVDAVGVLGYGPSAHMHRAYTVTEPT